MGSNVSQINSFEYDEEFLSRERYFAKLKKFAKEHFQDYVRYDSRSIGFLKWIPQHFAFNLPAEIDEYFISVIDAPYLWISKLPRILQIEQAVNAINTGKYSSNYHEIKKLYSKWITNKSSKEREYYARYIINLIEHESNTNNFLLKIIYATLISYDTHINLPDKALELLDECRTILDNSALEESIKQSVRYYIHLFSGFILLKKDEIELANLKFGEAQSFRENGITALFYNSLTLKRLQLTAESLTNIAKIVEFDRFRFNYAFTTNNLNLFSYFLRTAFSYKIFTHSEFSEILFDIETFFLADWKEFDLICGVLIDSLDNLMVIGEDMNFDDEVEREIEFLKQFIDKYRSSVNGLVPFSKNLLVQKFNSLIDLILAKIKQQRDILSDQNLFLYNSQIEKGNMSKELLHEASEKRKMEIKAHLEFEIKSIEESHKTRVAQIEEIIETLADENQFDPSQAFSSSMIINVVISLIIFIIGGFADGFINSGTSGNEAFFSTMIGGIKWGGITFLLGTIVSFFSSISAIWERSTKKQSLIKEISLRKTMKEKTIKGIKNDFSRKMEEFEDQLKRKIKSIDDDIESLTKDREMKAEEFRVENEEILNNYKNILRKVKIV